MASYQYVYHMDGVSKTYPGGKKCFENIRLSFLPGVKIGVVGVNGAGKSTLMRIMAGQDKDFTGEAWAAEGATVGYLSQEPELDDSLSVRENVMLGVAAKSWPGPCLEFVNVRRSVPTRLAKHGGFAACPFSYRPSCSWCCPTSS